MGTSSFSPDHRWKAIVPGLKTDGERFDSLDRCVGDAFSRDMPWWKHGERIGLNAALALVLAQRDDSFDARDVDCPVCHGFHG